MSYFDIQKKRMLAGGSSIREIRTLSSMRMINNSFRDDPSWEEVYINNSEEPTEVRVVTDTKKPSVKYILMRPFDKIHVGDYIYRSKLKEGYWICTGHDPSDIYHKGFIEKCNAELKWVDEDGLIHSYPCVFYYGTKANFGTYFDKVMTLPDGRRQVIVQKNEHTVKLKRDMRFIFGENLFVVIDHDHISEEGLVHLNLKNDLFNPVLDNMELGIANYYGRVADYSIKILNGDSVSIEQTQKLQINIEVLNNGTPVQNPHVKFIVNDPSIAEIDEKGLLTPLKVGVTQVMAVYENATSVINVSITENMANNYTVEILGSATINQGLSKTYSAVFRNNGIEFDEKALFKLTDLNGEETNCAEIVSSKNNTCVIRAGEKIDRFILHVESISGLIKNKKEIRITTFI